MKMLFMGCGMEIIQQSLDYLHFSFFVYVQMKFNVNWVFSIAAKTFNSSDIFNTNELITIMSQPDQITAKKVKGKLIYSWWEKISAKYSKLPSISELYDFTIVGSSDTWITTMLLHEWCYVGFTANVSIFLLRWNAVNNWKGHVNLL